MWVEVGNINVICTGFVLLLYICFIILNLISDMGKYIKMVTNYYARSTQGKTCFQSQFCEWRIKMGVVLGTPLNLTDVDRQKLIS